MNKVFQLPVLITGVRTTADKGLELKIHTRDLSTFTDEQLAALMGMHENEYWAAFSKQEVKPEEIDVKEERVDRGIKTASQRLRAVLYIAWEQKGSPEDFESYYRTMMEKFIDKVKENLDA